MLLAAYAESLRSEKSLNPDTFVIKYASEHYGFNKEQSATFWKALRTTPYEVIQGKVVSRTSLSLQQLVDSTSQATKVLDDLKPTKNETEYAQYKLMMDIRLHYLKYELIEAKVNSPSFSIAQVPGVLDELKKLIAVENDLDARFNELNKDYLYPSELAEENQLRNAKVRLLYYRLSRQK
jgi:hypothetical protein